MQTQTEPQQTVRENVFDENGQTVEVIETVIEAGATDAAPAAAVPADPPAVAKFRIGDREFSTEAEALAFATSEIDTRDRDLQVADAYRQGIRDGLNPAAAPAPSITPAAPVLNTEELYTNPQAFLDKYGQRVKEDAIASFNQTQNLKAQSDSIWREFTDRHPEMAEFRTEVEAFVQLDQANVRAIIQTKGRPASYDFIATKLKSRFSTYAEALKTKRALPNTGAGPTPTAAAGKVTPEPDPKKPLSFAEQVRSIRKRR